MSCLHPRTQPLQASRINCMCDMRLSACAFWYWWSLCETSSHGSFVSPQCADSMQLLLTERRLSLLSCHQNALESLKAIQQSLRVMRVTACTFDDAPHRSIISKKDAPHRRWVGREMRCTESLLERRGAVWRILSPERVYKARAFALSRLSAFVSLCGDVATMDDWKCIPIGAIYNTFHTTCSTLLLLFHL